MRHTEPFVEDVLGKLLVCLPVLLILIGGDAYNSREFFRSLLQLKLDGRG